MQPPSAHCCISASDCITGDGAHEPVLPQVLYWPGRRHWSGGHGVHVAWSMAPIEVEYFPVVHGRQSDENWAPIKAQYIPVGHAVQSSLETDSNAVEYFPAKHKEQSESETKP